MKIEYKFFVGLKVQRLALCGDASSCVIDLEFFSFKSRRAARVALEQVSDGAVVRLVD